MEAACDPDDKPSSESEPCLFIQHLNETPFLMILTGSYPSVPKLHAVLNVHLSDEKLDPSTPGLIGTLKLIDRKLIFLNESSLPFWAASWG